MQQKNPAESFFEGMQSVMEAQRKNFKAITEANQRALQGWQALARRQGEMVSQFVQDNAGAAREGNPPDVKNAYESSLANAHELVEIMRKTMMETTEVINRRIVAGVGEIKSSAQSGE